MLRGLDHFPKGAGFVSVAELVNFVIAGSVAWYAWHRGMTQLFGPPR